MSGGSLTEALEMVQDQASFLEFVRILKYDRMQAVRQERAMPMLQNLGGANGWANITVEDFLGGAVACVEDHGDDGMFPNEPTWRTFEEFLYCGKIYE